MYRLDYDLPTEVDTSKFRHKRGAVAMAQYDPSMMKATLQQVSFLLSQMRRKLANLMAFIR
jgi:hypothetical protein